MNDPHEVELHIGRTMRRLRRNRRMTQDMLADMIGVSFQTIQKYECGSIRISAFRLWEISEVLHVPISNFFSFQTFAHTISTHQGATNAQSPEARA